MPPVPRSAPSWDTSSLSAPADVSALECVALADHLEHCGLLRGQWHGLKTASDGLQGLLAARFVTVMVLVALMAALSWLVL